MMNPDVNLAYIDFTGLVTDGIVPVIKLKTSNVAEASMVIFIGIKA